MARRETRLRYLGAAADGSYKLGLADSPMRFLLVGDKGVGKHEFLTGLPEAALPNHLRNMGLLKKWIPRLATVAIDGHLINVQLCLFRRDTTGLGDFGTIVQSVSRGAHGVILVFDITNRWSWNAIKSYLREVDEFVPDTPRIIVGNRLHREFDRAVSRREVEEFASKRMLEYFEVSTLAHFNVDECLTQVARMARNRVAMQLNTKIPKNPETLESIASRTIVRNIKSVHLIERLPLPYALQRHLRSFAQGSQVASAALPISQRSRKGIFYHVAPKVIRRSIISAQQRVKKAVCSIM